MSQLPSQGQRRPREGSPDGAPQVPPPPQANSADANANSKAPAGSSWRSEVLQLLQEIHNADDVGMFRAPVRVEDVPGYHDVITTPIDLRTIRERVAAGHPSMQSVSDVYNALNLMISNALTFNRGRKNRFRRHAKKVQKEIERAWETRAESLPVPLDDMEYFASDGESSSSDDAFVGSSSSNSDGEPAMSAAEQVHALQQDQQLSLDELKRKYALAAERAEMQRLKRSGHAASTSSSSRSSASSGASSLDEEGEAFENSTGADDDDQR